MNGVRSYRAAEGALLLATTSVFLGCAQAEPARCGVVSGLGACLSVVNVEAYYPAGGGLTSNVDAFRGECEVLDPVNEGATKWIPEPFTDHNAMITLRNDPPLEYIHTPAMAPVVTFNSYVAEFSVNECVGNAVCPIIAPTSAGDGSQPAMGPTITLRGGETATITVPLVPLRKKFEYIDKGGREGEYPSYAASYRIEGFDDEGDVALSAAVQFSIGNFDNCSSSFP